MTALVDIDLARIRQYGTSQQRAFEELCYLVAWDMESLGEGTEIERRGTPDGGIEFSCLPSEAGALGRWAWQAKYLFRFDAGVFAQMTKSVLSALDSTPDLTKYFFLMPKDRTKAGERRWASNVAAWEAEAAKRGMSVEFVFRGESAIVKALTRDAHAGAIRYFFDKNFLTKQTFSDQVAWAKENLGARYDPRVNVETDARSVLDAVCRNDRFVVRIADAVSAVVSEHLYLDGTRADCVGAHDAMDGVRDGVGIFRRSCETLLPLLSHPGDRVFLALRQHAEALVASLGPHASSVDALLTEAAMAESRATGSRRGRSDPSRTLYAALRAIRSVSGQAESLLQLLDSTDTSAARAGCVVLVGEAGCGKSHLVADFAVERVADGLPTFLVLGQTLDRGLVEPQIASSVGLQELSLDSVLQALDVAARVRQNGRALVVVDALNEGPGVDLWRHQMRGLIAKFARFKWVALVLTIRDVYEGSIAADGIGSAVRSVHRGMMGHEEEALTLYAEHYKLRLPDVPSLLPELTNPLFLRSLCRAAQAMDLREIPRSSVGLGWVFSGLIEHVERTLRAASRLDYPDWETRVRDGVEALASRMVDDQSESLTLRIADEVLQAIHQSTTASGSLLSCLVQEGLLLRERRTPGGGPVETVRFTYQRLSDHLRAGAVLDRCESNKDLAAYLRVISKQDRRWAERGLIGSITLLLPERRETELATLLRLGRKVVDRSAAYRGSDADWLRVQVQDAFLETIVWRAPASFTRTATEMLDRYLVAGLVDQHEWLGTLMSLSCVPDHPLNVERLDRRLREMTLAERDQAWSRQLLWVASEDSNPVDRIIDWAWSRPESPAEVVRLAGLTLAWLFTSPDHRIRDCATKALVAITDAHTPVLSGLVAHFSSVNDPYVLERVVAAAQGHLLRVRNRDHSPESCVEAIELGRQVFDAVFAGQVTPHLKLRYRAQACVKLAIEIGSGHEVILDREFSRCTPPYESSWPLQPPTVESLADGYEREFSGYLGSVTPMDWEFDEHLEKRVLRYLVLPDQDRVRSERRVTLESELVERLDSLGEVSPPSKRSRIRRRAARLANRSRCEADRLDSLALRTDWEAFRRGLSKRATEASREVERTANKLRLLESEKMRPDADECSRWVAGRILDLGWTTALFGDQQQRSGRYSGERTSETIAKKYERIALQELTGILVDRCEIDEGWSSEPLPYEGPWQITELLDADPGLLVRGDEPIEETSADRLRKIRERREAQPAWYRTLADHQLDDIPDDMAWLNTIADVPQPLDLVRATDPLGEEWVALERHLEFEMRHQGLGDRFDSDRRWFWFRCQSYLVSQADLELAAWAAETNWMGLRHLSTPADTWLGEFGDYPNHGAWPSMIALADRERFWGDDADALDEMVPSGWEFTSLDEDGVEEFAYAVASTGSYQENDSDASAINTPGVNMPSPVVMGLLGAKWTGGCAHDVDALQLGLTEREYSWEAGGITVAFCTAARGYGGAKTLWVRHSSLNAMLAREGLVCWSWILGEKGFWQGGEPSTDRTDVYGAVQLSPGSPRLWGLTVEEDREGSTRGNRLGKVLHAERPPLQA